MKKLEKIKERIEKKKLQISKNNEELKKLEETYEKTLNDELSKIYSKMGDDLSDIDKLKALDETVNSLFGIEETTVTKLNNNLPVQEDEDEDEE